MYLFQHEEEMEQCVLTQYNALNQSDACCDVLHSDVNTYVTDC